MQQKKLWCKHWLLPFFRENDHSSNLFVDSKMGLFSLHFIHITRRKYRKCNISSWISITTPPTWIIWIAPYLLSTYCIQPCVMSSNADHSLFMKWTNQPHPSKTNVVLPIVLALYQYKSFSFDGGKINHNVLFGWKISTLPFYSCRVNISNHHSTISYSYVKSFKLFF